MDLSPIASTALSTGMPGLPALRPGLTPTEQRAAVSQQFEAILLRQFLGESVSSMMGGDDTPAGSVYGYLLGDVLSAKLAQGGGMGLSTMIANQLTPTHGPAEMAGEGPCS